MNRYITIDGGTTNTRLTLTENMKVIDTIALSFGARRGITDRDGYRREIGEAISLLLDRNSVSQSQITRILASGMITSEHGLHPLPHIPAPAGRAELHAAMQELSLPDVAEIPVFLIPGVKVLAEKPEDTDMMRGEETELYGMTDSPEPKTLYILPGSHSKLIRTDDEGRIADFETTLSGEMLAALSANTILADALDMKNANLNESALLTGYRMAMERGIATALFKTRILRNLFSADRDEVYSHFVGATLAAEINRIIEAEEKTIILGGNRHIKRAMAALLTKLTDKRLIVVDDETVALAPMRGAIRISEYEK